MQVNIFCTTFVSAISNGALVQLVRIRACHARGQGFESPTHRQEDDFLGRLFFVRMALVQRVAPRQTRLRKAVLLSQLLVFVKRLSLKIDFQTSFAKPKQSPIVPPFARSALGFCRRSSPAKVVFELCLSAPPKRRLYKIQLF